MSDLGKRFRRYFKGLQEAPLEAEIPPDLIFDDEPLEWLLYGEGAHRANPANIFRPARSYLQRIIEARQGNRMEEIATLISSLISGDHPIPQDVYESLAEIFLNSPDLDGWHTKIQGYAIGE